MLELIAQNFKELLKILAQKFTVNFVVFLVALSDNMDKYYDIKIRKLLSYIARI